MQQKPSADMTPILSSIPFARWGLDIVGPFPPSTSQARFIFVAVDYFTKWVEAQAVAKITQDAAVKFVYRSIVCRFGVPQHIVTDNGTQFTGGKFSRMCEDLGTKLHFASVYRPQANGQVEVTNKAIVQGLKKKIESAKGAWADKLCEILWAYRTTSKNPTGNTPFAMTYGVEAVVPIEMSIPTYRISKYDELNNDQNLATELELRDETRDEADLRNESYKASVSRYHNRQVRKKVFLPGTLVTRKASITERNRPRNKLSSNFEGPYIVDEEIRPGTYRLRRQDGTMVPNTWHADNMQQYYA